MSILPLHPELQATTRLRKFASPEDTAGLRDWLCLISAGAAAAVLSLSLDLHLRIPGHAILRAVFPMALGLALAPRRGAGTVMGGTALLAAVGLRLTVGTGGGMSLGALTSLAASGPLLDWSLHRYRRGRRQLLGFAAAGLAANLLALAVRGTAKAMAWEHVGARPLAAWLPKAAVTYVLCGLLAGLISGVVFFHPHRPPDVDSAEEIR